MSVLGYRDSFEKNYNMLREQSDPKEFRSYNPRCILIAGTAGGLRPDQTRSFELFRGALTDVDIWTFDEVGARVQGIREALAAPTDDA
jgi:nucleoside phosphorylase